MAVTAFIVSREAPATGKPGDIIKLSITSKQASDFVSDLIHSDAYKYLVFVDNIEIQKQPVTLPNNQEVTSTINVLMPDKDLNVRVELWYNEIAYISQYKADETLILVKKGTATGGSQKENETSVSLFDRILGDTQTFISVVLVIVIILFLIVYMMKNRK